jgi:xylulokinase
VTLFAGLDAGTSGGRCLVVDERGHRVAHAARAWSYVTDDTGFPTLDPAGVLRALEDACAEALAACDAREVRAVGVTSQRTGIVLLDAEGHELYVGPNADGRAIAEGIAMERAHGDLAYRVAGRLPAMLYLPARLAWFRKHRGAEPARALSLADWIVWKLTGRAVTEPTHAAEMLCFDVARGEWSDELCAALGVPRALLPEVLPAGETAGEARAWFAPGTNVVAAGADTQCAALALGALDPGEAVVVAGTTMLCEQVRADAVTDASRRTWTSPHALGARFVSEAHCGEAGAAVEWSARTLGFGVDAFAAAAATAPPGAGGVRFVDPFPSNVADFPLVRTGALMFPAPLLALGRAPADVARAVFEGIAFGARAGLDVLRDVNGPQRSVAVAGGVARAEPFARALAGARGDAVRVATEPESSALGAAVTAGASHHGGVREAADAMFDRGREVAPVEADGYPSHYAAWLVHASRFDADAMRVSDIT